LYPAFGDWAGQACPASPTQPRARATTRKSRQLVDNLGFDGMSDP